MRWKGDHFLTLGAFLLLVVLLAAGCATSDMTNPPRSVTEQLLLSTAADRAMTNHDFSMFNRKKVYVDSTYFDGYDSKYALGTVRDALSSGGALLVDSETNCDIIVQARSGGLSTDSSDSLVGIPKMGMPVPLSGALQIPEVALWKSQKQNAIAKFALLAYERVSREHVYSSGPLVGRAYNNYFKLLGIITWTKTDIPEKAKPKKQKHSHHQKQKPAPPASGSSLPNGIEMPAQHAGQPTG